MLAKTMSKFFAAALVGAALVASAAPAKAEGRWLWLESGSFFPVYREATPAFRAPVRVQRPRVTRTSTLVAPDDVNIVTPVPTPTVSSGSFWNSSRVYIAGLSF